LRNVAIKYPFNYGAIPQTWENPEYQHPDTQAKGREIEKEKEKEIEKEKEKKRERERNCMFVYVYFLIFFKFQN